ncbi:MAG: short-chain dehydrogenase [Opitutae bacterium]|nr:short-chain dehydrogenase [Opitutae bacterium]
MKRLGDKYRTALVTGGTSGLGLAFCELLVNEGVETFSASRHPSKLSPISGLHGLELDLKDLSSVVDFARSFTDENGVPDLLINNAGYGAFFDWDRFPEEEIDGQLDVMLKAPVILSGIFAPIMAEKGAGGIVNVSSLAVQFPLPLLPLYNAAKAGLSAFSSSLIMEFDGRAPFVVDFRPGDFCTPFNDVAHIEEDLASVRAARVWRGMKKRLVCAPSPAKAVLKLRSTLLRGTSGVVYAGGFFQASILPLLYRILPARYLLRSVSCYHGLGKPSSD